MKAAHDEVLEFQGEYEIEMMTNHLLEERIEQLEDVVASRNQVINGIEVKFTDYLRGCNESVNSEFSTLDGRLSRSTAEVHKGISSRTHGFRPRRRRFYYAHRRAGAQEESGRERRTEDLRQGHDHEGREYQDQVQSLHRLLINTEQRIKQMECDSEYAQRCQPSLC